MLPSVRGIGRRGRIYIDRKPLADSRRVAIPVVAVVGAVRGNIFALRGLRELPDLGKSHSALSRSWRALRKRASRSGRACIVNRPVNNCAFPRTLPDVFGSDD